MIHKSRVASISSSFVCGSLVKISEYNSFTNISLHQAYLNKPSLVAVKSEPLVILRSAFWEGNVACSSLISL